MPLRPVTILTRRTRSMVCRPKYYACTFEMKHFVRPEHYCHWALRLCVPGREKNADDHFKRNRNVRMNYANPWTFGRPSERRYGRINDGDCSYGNSVKISPVRRRCDIGSGLFGRRSATRCPNVYGARRSDWERLNTAERRALTIIVRF